MSRETKYRSNCGAEIDAEAEICPECGVRTESSSPLNKYLSVGVPTGPNKADVLSGAGALIGGMATIIGLFLP